MKTRAVAGGAAAAALLIGALWALRGPPAGDGPAPPAAGRAVGEATGAGPDGTREAARGDGAEAVRGAGNEERGTGDEVRGAGNETRGAGDEGRGAGNEGRGTGDEVRAAGDEGRAAGDEGRGAGDEGRGARDQARSGGDDVPSSRADETPASEGPRTTAARPSREPGDPPDAPAPRTFVASEVQPLAVLRTEVTARDVAACIAARACRAEDFAGGARCTVGDDARADHPASCATHAGARAFCAWLGARLPTAAEWLAEATDGGQRRHPWGDEPATCDRAIVRDGCGRGGLWPACSRPLGNSRTGVCDLVGNALEWTAQVRGGRARVMGEDLSVNLGKPVWIAVGAHAPEVGFRCVRDGS